MDHNINEGSLLKLIKERKQKENKRPKKLSPEEVEENVIHWTTFYRRNINIYIHRRLGVNLHPFQHVMIFLMSISDLFFAICSRGLAKTFDVAIFAVATCMIKPYSEVVITASTIEQARRMVKDKMVDELFAGKMSPQNPFLKYLYKNGHINVIDNKDEIKVEFLFNGSWIKVLPANENSRGSRATLLIYEECRLLKKGIIDSVFSKMAHPRQVPFMNLNEYRDEDGKPMERWLENCKTVYITSARFTSEWFWKVFQNTVRGCFNSKNLIYNFFAGDIFLSIMFGLKKKSDYYLSRDSGNDMDFRMEDLNEMFSESDDSFFNRAMFKKNQVRFKPFIPPTTEDIMCGNDLKNREKQDNEYRLLYIDYAFSNTTSKEENDHSVIGCLSCFYDENGKFKRITDYITTHPASDSDGMERKIRELFWDYQCDYIVLDLRNGGELAFNNLTKSWKHPERSQFNHETGIGWNEHGFTVCGDIRLHVVPQAKVDDLKSRTVDQEAIPCVIPIVGTADLNSLMWVELKKCLINSEMDLLVEDIEYNEILEADPNYYLKTNEEILRLKLPVVQTMMLIGEAVSLSEDWKDGKVKLTQPRSGHKDRIVAFSYGNYIATLIQNKIDKEEQQSSYNADDWFAALS